MTGRQVRCHPESARKAPVVLCLRGRTCRSLRGDRRSEAIERLRQREGPMIDKDRRTILTTGAAVAAATVAPQVFAQAPQAGAVQGLPAGAKVGFYEKGNVRIRYAEIGSGFPLLAAPGGGLNSGIGV